MLIYNSEKNEQVQTYTRILWRLCNIHSRRYTEMYFILHIKNLLTGYLTVKLELSADEDKFGLA